MTFTLNDFTILSIFHDFFPGGVGFIGCHWYQVGFNNEI
jgi:hypothetical protein